MDDIDREPEVSTPQLKRKRTGDGSSGPRASAFRNVTACSRCRTRKHKCDLALPACSDCVKAGADCVGFDPVSNRDVPRNYVLWLEQREQLLSDLLHEHGIPVPMKITMANAPTDKRSDADTSLHKTPSAHQSLVRTKTEGLTPSVYHTPAAKLTRQFTGPDSRVSKSAISFASVVQEAVRQHIRPATRRPSRAMLDGHEDKEASLDTFFGLYSPSSIEPAPFPSSDKASELIALYFEFAHPQIPALHRGEFEALVDHAYKKQDRSPRTVFFVHIICAIGAGTIWEKSLDPPPPTDSRNGTPTQAEPEQYYAAAMHALQHFMSTPKACTSTPAGLEELQAVLLLANFALLRPVAPGLWYIAGVAMRQAKNLGLYQDGPEDINTMLPDAGSKLWSRDMRRRLWWCTYSVDRLVSTCVGRPTSIDETLITTPFPTILDDKFISPTGFQGPPMSPGQTIPSSKRISFHYFRLRLLQSEILSVLEARRAHLIRRAGGLNLHNPFMPPELQEHFLERFRGDFRQWRSDINRRLDEWKQQIPTREASGVRFEPLYLELNYWQTMVMLYRHSLSVPAALSSQFNETAMEESKSIRVADAETQEDEQIVFYRAGVAGQAVLGIYKTLAGKNLVNYTYLATHFAFICGVTFLSSIWQSHLVRDSISQEDIELTVLAGATVLTRLARKCPPAENARDAFQKMSEVTINFYAAATAGRNRRHAPQQPTHRRDVHTNSRSALKPMSRPARDVPRFDTDFRALFSDEDLGISPRTTLRQLPSTDFHANIDPQLASQQQKEQQHNMPTFNGLSPTTPSSAVPGRPPPSETASHHSRGQDSDLTLGPDGSLIDPQLAGNFPSATPTASDYNQQHSVLDDDFWTTFAADNPLLLDFHTAATAASAGGGHAGIGGGAVTMVDDNDWGAAGLGFELGFGAGAVPLLPAMSASAGKAAPAPEYASHDGGGGAARGGHVGGAAAAGWQHNDLQQWPEKGFNLLDGWLVNGRTPGM